MLTIHSESLLVSDSLSSLSSRAIVMLCNIEESGKRKCEPYWPVVIGTPVRLEISEGYCSLSSQISYGNDITVTCTKSETWEKFMTKSTLQLTVNGVRYWMEALYRNLSSLSELSSHHSLPLE